MIRKGGLDVIILSRDAALFGVLLFLSGLASRARGPRCIVNRAVSAPLVVVVGVGKKLLLSDGIRGALRSPIPLYLVQVNNHVSGVVQALRGFKGDRHDQLVGLLRGGSLLAACKTCFRPTRGLSQA